MDEQPYDDRHNTPPRAEQNPFDYEGRVISAMRHAARWLDRTRADRGAMAELHESVSLMHTELMRLRNTPQPLTEVPSMPEPGIVYADPTSRFECKPADSAWTGEYLSLLELRVMRAHLLTALDNTNAALRQKGSVTR
jgi:hypothetical protein